jgi:hypothetical protein
VASKKVERMPSIARFVISTPVFVAVYLLSFWLLLVQIFPENLSWMATMAALLTAMATACLIWRSMAATARGVFATAVRWAAIAGAISFCGGFFGPMIFAPDANQGPMLGLFITGPLGFLAGGICGLIYALWRRPVASTCGKPPTRGLA